MPRRAPRGDVRRKAQLAFQQALIAWAAGGGG